MASNIVEEPEGPKGNGNGNGNAEGTTLNHSNILRERKDDVYKKYEIIQVLGNGSMGAVTKVKIRDECVGGSAFNAPKSPRKGHPILNSFRDMFRGSSKKSNPKPSNSVKQQLQNNSTDGSNSTSTHEPQVFALKSIQLDRISPLFLKELENEIDILRTMDHPNIVKAHEVYWASSSGGGSRSHHHNKQIYIVLDCCDGGDLYTRSPYSERQSARITANLTSAIKYMHDHGIVHRDLKFENIMFESSSPNAQIKILDFGLSKKFCDKPGMMTERVGTVYTMAPQVLQGIYSSQADLWSVGVMAYMLLSASKPFYHKRRRQMIDQIMRADFSFQSPVWETISEDAKDFVSKLLVVDPNVRMDATEALQHTWIVNREETRDELPSEALLKTIDGCLLNYVQTSAFKRLALNVIAHQANSSQDILRLRNAFKAYDTNRNGVITYLEFEQALEKMNYSPETIQAIFNSIDVDRDGDIEYTEFLGATIEAHGHIEEIRIAEAFDRLDADDSGYISKADLKSVMGSELDPVRLEELMAEADADKDGKISYPEFLALFRQTTHQIAKDAIRETSSDSGSDGSEDGQLVGLDAHIPGGLYDSNLGPSERKQADYIRETAAEI